MSLTISDLDTAPALADLEARAGASDQNREAWLAERRQGITATEIRDLYLRRLGRSSYVSQADLIARKLGRIDEVADLSHVPVIGWGKEREPIIAARLTGEGFAPESRVFHHPDNSRYLASPDGIAVTFDDELHVSEIKTAGYDLPPGSERFDAKGYLFQVQWVMYVIGAARCRFVVEERHEDPDGSFFPGPEHRHWIERDDALIAELVAVADEFLAELDRQREEGAPAIDEEVDTHAVNYLRAIAEEKAWAALKKHSYAALIDLGISQKSPLARVTITPGTPDEVLELEEVDLEAAEAAHPKEAQQLARAKARVEKLQAAWDELANQHTKTVPTVKKGKAARATVTAGKGTK
ncbi:YqaJ viral recombinase family protein [Leucobacter massiliensis]|uniref:YqaJ viral recombinase domain-containing protein n=1 Tax=Leucobacter massiliensis TaxID=1686285 RepID=A0A2S9QMY1_9MICO|nr:YqaJ viral recombinase family protein [Leucobacter massiliensis]PRI10948.1 hypothetical protein B4915_08675 [Leucobacter massiliensis]